MICYLINSLNLFINQIQSRKPKILLNLWVVKSQAKTALVLPRWEGQPWWKLVQDNAHIYALGQAGTVVAPNEYGCPRWDLVLAEFI